MNFAIVPAAGLSTRMGRPKLTLPLGDRTIIEHVISALQAGGVEQIVVVTGPHAESVNELAASAGANVVALREPTPDMRTTVEHGLAWIEARFHPRPDDRWLLAPGDHPALNPAVVKQLLAAGENETVVIPTYRGQRGHPTRFVWKHVAGIRQLPAQQGINALVRNGSAVIELSVDDAGILVDIDTRGDYEKIMRNTFKGVWGRERNELVGL
ncbi:MAG TPA: nucleotidyltransferase family protein [Gemmataceae bacterium]|jgi:molybdenum cofactor cytidylyltransferase|nr:nucleotidyltransferase family protein [Gemmataceae bacterium]